MSQVMETNILDSCPFSNEIPEGMILRHGLPWIVRGGKDKRTGGAWLSFDDLLYRTAEIHRSRACLAAAEVERAATDFLPC